MLAMESLAARGLAVPGDVSVVSFDGVPESTRVTPALTIVAQPMEETTARAMAALLDEQVPKLDETLPLALVERSSTARPPGS